jgi:hypothetical protein
MIQTPTPCLVHEKHPRALPSRTISRVQPTRPKISSEVGAPPGKGAALESVRMAALWVGGGCVGHRQGGRKRGKFLWPARLHTGRAHILTVVFSNTQRALIPSEPHEISTSLFPTHRPAHRAKEIPQSSQLIVLNPIVPTPFSQTIKINLQSIAWRNGP